MTRVRLWQIDSSESESVHARIERVLAALPDHAAAADFLVLPELWHIGAFNLAAVQEHAIEADNPLLSHIAGVAASAGAWIHAGSFAVRNGEKAFNQSYVFGPDGAIAATYRKRHLFGFEDGERTVIDASDDITVFDSPVGHTGLATCYDLRFPEQFRELVEHSAQTFVLCSGWPTPRIEHWNVLTRARAIENQALVIACNGRGTHAGVTLAGNSVVIDPRGEVIANAGVQEFVDAEVDISTVDAWRLAFPVLDDR